MWRLIVAGLEAVGRGVVERTFIEETLSNMSQDLGIYVTMFQISVAKIWASGDTGWDDVFDTPYVFPTYRM